MEKPPIEINNENKHNRVATPIYVEIVPAPVTDEDVEKLKDEFQRVLMEALQNGTKIPYTDEGSEFAQKLFMEAYDRVMKKIYPNGFVTITVEIEK